MPSATGRRGPSRCSMPVSVRSWSTNRQLIVVTKMKNRTGDLTTWPLANNEMQDFLATPFDERGGMLSPDENWVAYTSNESGRFEIYAQKCG